MKSENSDLIVRKVAGGSIVQRRPIFSIDVTTLFVVWDESVRSYNVQTGEFVKSYEGLGNRVVGVELNPTNPDHLVACSVNGDLMEWNWRDGKTVRKINLQRESSFRFIGFHMLASPNGKLTIYGAGSKSGMDMLTINSFDYNSGKLQSIDLMKVQANRNYRSYAFGGGLEQPFLAGLQESSLHVAALGNNQCIEKQQLQFQKQLTCVACHPSTYSVLVGDVLGRVQLCQGFFSNKKAVLSEYHWHTLPVEDVVFSSMGSHFYSGGGEGVLVKWTVNNPLQKKYLPRLPASLIDLAIAPENSLLAITTMDNGIQLVDTSLKLVSVIQHFSWSAECVRRGLTPFPAGLAVDTRSEALVLNGGTGHVQFFSLLQNTMLYQLNITGQNLLTQEREKEITNTDVIKLALSCDGLWMVTVEHRDDQDSSPELRLKFWQFDTEKQTFSLNTSIENPHKSIVYSVVFSSSKPLLVVTTGDDLKFRSWRLVESTSIYKRGLVWRNESVGFFRNQPAYAVSFSEDSSLLAVTFGPTLTVWISESNEMKCSLTRSSDNQHDLTHVEFGHRDCIHLVVTGSKHGIAVWNLLSLSLVWTVQVPLSRLIADPCSCLMAAFTTNNALVLFSPLHSEPVHKQYKLLPEGTSLVSAVFAKGSSTWKGHPFSIYIATSHWQLLVLEGAKKDSEKPKQDSEGLFPMMSQVPLTPFGALMAQQTTSDVQMLEAGGKHQLLGIPGAASVKHLLGAPAHTNAPMSLLCGSLLLAMASSGEKLKSGEGNEVDKNDEDSSVAGIGNIRKEEEEQILAQEPKLNLRKDKSKGDLSDQQLEEELAGEMKKYKRWARKLSRLL